MFENVIGQEGTKRKLTFFVGNGGVIPHLMFVSEKGCGKTFMAEAFAKQLGKPYFEINCSTIKNMKGFFSQYLISKIWGKNVTILFDEASELPRDVTMALLTMLNPNSSNRNSIRLENYNITIDFTKQTFIFATTEPQKVFHALMDRCERVDLEPYLQDDLVALLKKNIHSSVDYMILRKLSALTRGNPRAAVKMAEHVNNYISQNRVYSFGQPELDKLKYTLNILPLGITQTELQILQTLEQDHVVRLTHIAAKLGLTASSVQRHFENYLIRLELIQINQNGRSLTEKGRLYLQKTGQTANV